MNAQRTIRRTAALAIAVVCSACVTDPNAPPEPGSERWYVNRLQEIESAKADGHLTEEQYLTLKNQADATRAARLNAIRYDNSYGFGPYHDFSYH